MFKTLKNIFSKKEPVSVSLEFKIDLEYLVSEGSGLFIVWNKERTDILNTFQEWEGIKMKRWLKNNGYHIEDRFETVI